MQGTPSAVAAGGPFAAEHIEVAASSTSSLGASSADSVPASPSEAMVAATPQFPILGSPAAASEWSEWSELSPKGCVAPPQPSRRRPTPLAVGIPPELWTLGSDYTMDSQLMSLAPPCSPVPASWLKRAGRTGRRGTKPRAAPETAAVPRASVPPASSTDFAA
mmetsp:Transcript_21139/g.60399  ORF Transcript_21139/g.60399 Transcript_21139/m.60399 type:complete len:163 (+) Transcript_21139:81-569(+)